MNRAKASRLVAIWFALALGVELFGACGYPVHAGHFGGLAVSKGPIAVLIVEETSERNLLTDGQRNAILSNADDSVLAYCKTHCEKDAGGVPQFRVIDKDDSVAKESPVIQALFAAKRESVPWLVVKRGATIMSEPLPKSEADTLALLQRYGGK